MGEISTLLVFLSERAGVCRCTGFTGEERSTTGLCGCDSLMGERPPWPKDRNLWVEAGGLPYLGGLSGEEERCTGEDFALCATRGLAGERENVSATERWASSSSSGEATSSLAGESCAPPSSDLSMKRTIPSKMRLIVSSALPVTSRSRSTACLGTCGHTASTWSARASIIST